MLHEVRIGPCDDSFGINIARLAGFPEDVLTNASSKVSRLEKFAGLEHYEPFTKEDDIRANEEKNVDLRKKLRVIASLQQAKESSDLLELAGQIFVGGAL